MVIKFRLSDKPVNEGCARHIRSTLWENPKVLERKNRQRAKDLQPIDLQRYAFGHFCRDGSFLVDSDTLGKGSIACDLDLRKIRQFRLAVQLERGTSDMQSSNSFVNNIIVTFLGTTRKFASYTPSQIKTVITTDPSQPPYLVILDSDTPPIFESTLPTDDFSAPLGLENSDKQSSLRIPSLHDDRQMPPSCH